MRTSFLLTTTVLLAATAGHAFGNLITNGDFELGNTGFTSSYTYVLPGFNTIDGAARYGVGLNPQQYTNPGGVLYGDHTSGTGKMFIANGATNASLVWRQGAIPVVPGKQYVFSYFLSSWSHVEPALMECRINGEVVGTAQASSTIGSWSAVSHTWNSGTNTAATIELRDLQTAYVGNDFTIDDLTFAPPESAKTPAEQIEDILNFVDESVANGTLVAEGPGQSGADHLGEIIDYLETAQREIANEWFADALATLDKVYTRCDGDAVPPDWLAGTAASELAEEIQVLQALIAERVIEISDQPGFFHLDTGFDVKLDGFTFVNTGDLIPDDDFWWWLELQGGACFGMSAFAQWYYTICVKHHDNPIHLREICNNTELFPYAVNLAQIIAALENWDKMIPASFGLPDKEAIRSIIADMYLFRNPVLVLMGQSNILEKGHAVLAYRAWREENTIYVSLYDPNHPGEKSHRIIYDLVTEEAWYGEYVRFYPISAFNW